MLSQGKLDDGPKVDFIGDYVLTVVTILLTIVSWMSCFLEREKFQ